jgi:hypothetical protein
MGSVTHTETRNGKAAAVCCFCNRKSRPTEVCSDGEPDLWKMPQGWSQAPYPADFQHRDGSLGSTYTCPACNKLLRRGETLKLRGGGVTANTSGKPTTEAAKPPEG